MPLESRQGGDISKSRMCGVEIGFKSSITDAIRFNIEHGPFDLILAPLVLLLSIFLYSFSITTLHFTFMHFTFQFQSHRLVRFLFLNLELLYD
jgi:hypothetical protein